MSERPDILKRLAERPLWLAIAGAIAVFVAVGAAWQGGLPQFLRDYANGDAIAIPIVGLIVTFLGIVFVVALGQWLWGVAWQSGRRLGELEEADRAGQRLKRERETREEERRTTAREYAANVVARLHVQVRGGMLGSTWEELHRLRGDFPLTIVSTAIWPQTVTVHSVRFQPQGGGEWFVCVCADGPRVLELGQDYVPSIQPHASEPDIRQVMSHERMRAIQQGHDAAHIPGNLLVTVSVAFADEKPRSHPLTVPTVLRVELPVDPQRPFGG